MPPSKDPRAPRSRRLASHWFLLISREGSSPWNLDAAAFDCRSARWRAFRWSHAAGDPPVGGKGEKVRGFAAGRAAKAAVDERAAASIPRGRARVQLPARAPGPGQRDDVELGFPSSEASYSIRLPSGVNVPRDSMWRLSCRPSPPVIGTDQ